MPKKDQPITQTFKKTKNPRDSSALTQKTDVKPSTSSTSEEKHLDLLRQFDLNWEYGPCIGITRLERWERAEKHGLNPSPEVRQVVLDNSNDEKYTKCVWNDYKDII